MLDVCRQLSTVVTGSLHQVASVFTRSRQKLILVRGRLSLHVEFYVAEAKFAARRQHAKQILAHTKNLQHQMLNFMRFGEILQELSLFCLNLFFIYCGLYV